MNKNIFISSLKTLAIAAGLMSMSGCDDFLEYTPYGPVDTSSFWKTEVDVQSALDAFYDYT